MVTRYTSNKAPDMAVIVGSGGVYVHLPDGVVQAQPKKVRQAIPKSERYVSRTKVEQIKVDALVLDQFQAIDESITWSDIDKGQ